MTDIDEAMLIAWVDGELDEVTRRRVDRAVADDPALAARLETFMTKPKKSARPLVALGAE